MLINQIGDVQLLVFVFLEHLDELPQKGGVGAVLGHQCGRVQKYHQGLLNLGDRFALDGKLLVEGLQIR
jgi:hypothetical protein